MFYFSKDLSSIHPIKSKFKNIDNPNVLYKLLSKNIWRKDTCAPRMRSDWNLHNKTCGQCSITAFLVQDIFGGEVYGVPLDDNNFHCFNVINKIVFDLTSEQFYNKKLKYTLNYPQDRKVHFKKKEKYQRYKLLKSRLLAACSY